MNDKLVICKKCIEDFKTVPYTTPFQYRGLYTNFKVPDDNLCNICKESLYVTQVTKEEIKILFAISHDNEFLQAMIDLKEKDIIEYNLKMSQFKSQLEQQKSVTQASSNTIKCPTCNSTEVKRISGTAKVAGAVAFGLFSKTARSQFKCENCGYKW